MKGKPNMFNTSFTEFEIPSSKFNLYTYYK